MALNGIRHTLTRLLPPPLRQGLRRWYYPRVVAKFSPDRWPPAIGARQLVRAGDVVVDAGANVGYVTALLAQWVGASGRVHSFEPVPITADLLRRSVSRLKIKQVSLHFCGVSDAAGEAKMSIPQYADGGENLYESRVIGEEDHDRNVAVGAKIVSIPLRRLDDELSAEIPRITFMKIDVEGHEESALQGAEKILKEAQPALLIEIMGDLDDASASAGRVLAYLAGFNYAPYFWDNRWRPRQPGESAVDYFFLTPQHLKSQR